MDIRLGSLVAELDGPADGPTHGPADGPAVVMIHGLGGSSTTFAPLLPAIPNTRVLRPDLAGSARSGGTVRAGIDGLARGVTELMRVAGIGRAVLVGHSLGTLVAMEIAARRPEAVAGLVLYGAILEPPAPARMALRDRADRAEAEGMAGIAAAVASASLSAATRAAQPVAEAFVRESLLRQPPRGYAAQCRALAEMTPPCHARLTMSAALITGAEDPVAPPAMARALAEHLPQARVEILPACGHWPTVEAPEAAARLLAGALTEMTGPAPARAAP